MREWKIGSTNSVIIPGMRDVEQDRVSPSQKNYLNSGLSITGTIVGVGDFGAFTNIAGTNGDWRGDIDVPTTVAEGTILTATMTSAAPYFRTWKVTGRAVYGR